MKTITKMLEGFVEKMGNNKSSKMTNKNKRERELNEYEQRFINQVNEFIAVASVSNFDTLFEEAEAKAVTLLCEISAGLTPSEYSNLVDTWKSVRHLESDASLFEDPLHQITNRIRTGTVEF